MGLKFAIMKDENSNPRVKSPERAGVKEAGLEFYVPYAQKKVTLGHGESILIPLGVKVRLPEVPVALSDTHEYMLEFKNKSGTAYKKGVTIGSCVIDTTYQGELFLNLHNNTNSVIKPSGEVVENEVFTVSPGDNLIQGVLVLVNIEPVEELLEENLYLETTQRGDQGFGSNYREEAVSKIDDVKDYATDKFDDAKESMEDAVARTKGLASDARELASDTVDDVKNKAGRVLGSVKGLFGKKNK